MVARKKEASLQPAMKRKSVSKAFSHGIKVSGAKRQAPSRVRPKPLKSGGAAAEAVSPYAGFARPTAAEVHRLHSVLAQHFGARTPTGGKKRPILDTVVGTILSQNTTNTNSHRAFQQLKRDFRTWDAVRTARPAAVQAAIKCGGLAPKKTKWIQHILRTVHGERGRTSLEHLRKSSKEEVHEALECFQGIGKKTSAIINLFDVGHPDMAVDTHVFRYALQLGWVPSEQERLAHNKKACGKPWPVVTRDRVYEHLDARFPDELKYSMHLILTDTVGGLPVHCGASRQLSFDGQTVRVDGAPLQSLTG